MFLAMIRRREFASKEAVGGCLDSLKDYVTFRPI